MASEDYRKYLDEKFTHLTEVMNERFNTLSNQIKESNKQTSIDRRHNREQFDRIENKLVEVEGDFIKFKNNGVGTMIKDSFKAFRDEIVAEQKKYLKLIGIGFFLAGFIYIKESRDFLVGLLIKLVTGL
jgi:hypothetical protein